MNGHQKINSIKVIASKNLALVERLYTVSIQYNSNLYFPLRNILNNIFLNICIYQAQQFTPISLSLSH
jgi:hypothetical protein